MSLYSLVDGLRKRFSPSSTSAEPGWTEARAGLENHPYSLKTATITWPLKSLSSTMGAGTSINAVEPGTVLTEGPRELTRPEEIETLAQAIPWKRPADPEDVAFAMMFLASADANYLTGQTIVVDGGQILPESKLAIV